MKNKAGRKPIGDKAFTAVQKTQRQRKKTSLKLQVAKDSGCRVQAILINDNQLLTLSKLFTFASKNTQRLDDRKLDDVIYHALKMYINEFKADLIDNGLSPEVIDKCDTTNYPEDLNTLMGVQVKAQNLFKEWEQSQLTGEIE